MTIEGRPKITPDPLFEKNLMESYSQQRKCRMADAISDYLNDEDVSARRTYEEMLDEVNDVIEYHQRNLDKAKELRSLMMGNRPVDLNDPQFLTEDRWSNFPKENGDYITGLSEDILAL